MVSIMGPLHTSVAASLLPASRSRVAALFKIHRREAEPLQAVADACGLADQHLEAACASADRLLAEAGRTGIEVLPWFDPAYPILLDCTPDPPPALWIQGSPASLSRPTVAVVGSRGATEYARQVAERIAAELASRSIVVASGLARGVDSAAHQGCLRAGGETVAVLGSGLDRIYPPEHAALASRIRDHGTLASELGPGAPPLPEHFPLRNRIISGLSLAVVVVEASDRSGSLITARCALEQGRDVMAVPGSVLSGRNRGSHGLLKDGATVVESADDILQALGWQPSPPGGRRGPGARETDPLLSKMEPGEHYRLDDLMALTGVDGPRLLPRLMELELQGRVIAGPGGAFTRAASS
jgi:DNA processing protein